MRPPDRPAAPAPVRVLVADDEEGTLALLTDVLTYAGFAVVQARDGLEALTLAHDHPPAVALLDVMMPGLDGREVCRRMRADDGLARVPVILCSATAIAPADWRAAGADAFLQKPFPMRNLAELVRAQLRSAGEPG